MSAATTATLGPVHGPVRPPSLQRLHHTLRKRITVTASGCWRWGGAVSGSGYGRVWWDGRMHRVHRLVYRLLVGEIPDGHELDHDCHDGAQCPGGPTCPHRRCCRPGDVTPLTPAENHARVTAPDAVALRRALDNGHLFPTPERSPR